VNELDELRSFVSCKRYIIQKKKIGLGIKRDIVFFMVNSLPLDLAMSPLVCTYWLALPGSDVTQWEDGFILGTIRPRHKHVLVILPRHACEVIVPETNKDMIDIYGATWP
jgi:hypothetical protein